MFSIINAVLLRPLPYKDADRLVGVWGRLVERPQHVPVFTSFRAFQERERHSQSFERLEACMWAGTGQTLLWEGLAQRVLPVHVTAGFFALLGVQASHGRTFEPADRSTGCDVVLSDGFWRNRLGGSLHVVGGSLTLDNQPCTVIGVAPPAFEFCGIRILRDQ